MDNQKALMDPIRTENVEKLRKTRIISELKQYEVNGNIVKITAAPENTYYGKWAKAKEQSNADMKIIVSDEDSFGCVINHIDEMNGERVLVLNFANPFIPGGGVRSGARAQEEDLCRRSNLLQALEDEVAAQYYENNKSERPFSYGYEDCILTKNVSIFIDSSGNLMPCPIVVDVITAAAPKLNGKTTLVIPERMRLTPLGYCRESDDTPLNDFVDDDIIHGIYEYDPAYIEPSRFDELVPDVYGAIDNICEMILSVAENQGYKNIVLGAFGCGAFKNDPRDVANAFKKALQTKSFDKVYFPILKRHDRGRKNYEVFCEILGK